MVAASSGAWLLIAVSMPDRLAARITSSSGRRRTAMEKISAIDPMSNSRSTMYTAIWEVSASPVRRETRYGRTRSATRPMSDRGMKSVGQRVFKDDSAGADVERLNNLLGGDGGGEQDDLDGRRTIHDGAHSLKAGQAGHLHVEEEDIGQMLKGLGDGLIAIVGFSDYFEAFALGEHVAHTDTDYRMIIGEYDADGLLFHESPIPPKSRD